jgi:hypothetical protein
MAAEGHTVASRQRIVVHAGMSSHTQIVLIGIVVVGAIAAFVYMKSKDDSSKEDAQQATADAARAAIATAQAKADAAKADAAKAKAQADTALVEANASAQERAAIDKELQACKARTQTGRLGDCFVDSTTKRAYMRCASGYYGEGCKLRCEVTSSKPRHYTAGGELGRKDAATCVCPPDYHFSDRNVASGCVSTTDGGVTGCAAGWHGVNCELTGNHLDCGAHGTQNSTSCDCNQGYAGDRCQYETSMCNTQDPGATMTAAGVCDCSEGMSGTWCKTLDASNYTKDAAGNIVHKTICSFSLHENDTGGTCSRGATQTVRNSVSGAAKQSNLSATSNNDSISSVNIRRLKGVEPCTLRLFKDSGYKNCYWDVTLPTGQNSLTSKHFSHDAGDSASSLVAGTTAQVDAVPVYNHSPCGNATFSRPDCVTACAAITDGSNASNAICNWGPDEHL